MILRSRRCSAGGWFIIAAMESIEKDYENLKGVLPKQEPVAELVGFETVTIDGKNDLSRDVQTKQER